MPSGHNCESSYVKHFSYFLSIQPQVATPELASDSSAVVLRGRQFCPRRHCGLSQLRVGIQLASGGQGPEAKHQGIE